MIGWNPPNSHSFFKIQSLAAVLVAIAIPVFTTQLEKSRESTDIANVRSGYAVLVTNYLSDGTTGTYQVSARQTVTGWQGGSGTLVLETTSGESTYSYEPVMSGSNYTITTALDASGNISVTVG